MQCVLDIDCGTGISDRVMAPRLPSTQFVGVGVNPPLSRELATAANKNCSFIQANAEQDWEFIRGPSCVDFVFARMLTTAIRDWRGLFRRAFITLKPGGYLESQETCIGLFADDAESSKDSALMHRFRCLQEILSGAGIVLDSINKHGETMKEVGFEIVTERHIRWYSDSNRPEMRGRERIGDMVTQQIAGILDTMTPKIFSASESIFLEERKRLSINAKEDLYKKSGKLGFHTRSKNIDL